jgi:hypothetical protein
MKQTTTMPSANPRVPGKELNAIDLTVREVRQRLAQSHYHCLRQVGCEPVGGSFVLWGSVTSYYAKQLAQTLAGSLVGIEHIKNRIVVETAK